MRLLFDTPRWRVNLHSTGLQLLGTLWMLVLVSACNWVHSDSEDIKTSGLYLDVQLTEESEGAAYITMSLFVGGRWGNRVFLTGEDHWEVNGEPSESGEVHTSSSRTYEITLVRSDERLSTTVALPEPLVITELEPAEVVSWSETLTVYWTPSPTAGLLEVSVDGPCMTRQATIYSDDPGMHTSQPILGHPEMSTCTLEVGVTRTQHFEVHEAFDNGQVTLVESEMVELDYER